ncbi:hypothetical protein BRYFOR_05798 [Marvinbryantia formatexigens DSM 14469]|uniref:Uncharacterized protein n=1 Tax=Marvinbryantia formatexigens DSM 14469 TaxID=478749 RepID=C6LB02_9FIRM|nr:hypothetical protein BRYFOR_05798 [Marvinbryantia formatexigens DSM 14469]
MEYTKHLPESTSFLNNPFISILSFFIYICILSYENPFVKALSAKKGNRF